ncbi:MAG: alpha/beta hydrolase [Chitinophagaceae bacterium]|nr:alpha/beta hydrolase [Chitinophagaceae bacterium]
MIEETTLRAENTLKSRLEKTDTEETFTEKSTGKYFYYAEGTGEPLVLLYGLFGSVKNYSKVIAHFKKSYTVIVPQLPIYDLGLNVSVGALSDYVHQLMQALHLEKIHLVGNSLGGHIALLYCLHHPENVKSLILVGSSGLFENGMGDTFPRRGDYNYIKKKAEITFFKPETATKELVDEIFETVNNRVKALKILCLAKSTIKYNLRKELATIKCDCCIVWGRQDAVTPPETAEEFNKLIPQSSLFWIDNCGHVPMLETPETFNRILSEFLEGRK